MNRKGEMYLTEQAVAAIRGYELQYGGRAVAWHATVDTIHLLYGVALAPVFLRIFDNNRKLVFTSVAECDAQILGSTEGLTADLPLTGQRIELADFTIDVCPLIPQTSLVRESNLLRDILADEGAGDVILRYLKNWMDEKAEPCSPNVGEIPPTISLPSRLRRPYTFDFLDRRASDVLSHLESNPILSLEVCGKRFQTVWIAMKIQDNRIAAYQYKNQNATVELPHRFRLLPTNLQVRACVAANLGMSKDTANAMLVHETGDGVYTAFDTAGVSGYLATQYVENGKVSASDKRGAYHETLLNNYYGTNGIKGTPDADRKKLISSIACRFENGNSDIFRIYCPIHVFGSPFFVIRLDIPGDKVHHSIGIYSGVVPVIAGQLRQMAQDAVVEEFRQRLSVSSRKNLQKVLTSLQHPYPIPVVTCNDDWTINEIGSNVNPSWNQDFKRHDPEFGGMRIELQQVLNEWRGVGDYTIPEYVKKAIEQAKQAVTAAQKRTERILNHELNFNEQNHVLYESLDVGVESEYDLRIPNKSIFKAHVQSHECSRQKLIGAICLSLLARYLLPKSRESTQKGDGHNEHNSQSRPAPNEMSDRAKRLLWYFLAMPGRRCNDESKYWKAAANGPNPDCWDATFVPTEWPVYDDLCNLSKIAISAGEYTGIKAFASGIGQGLLDTEVFSRVRQMCIEVTKKSSMDNNDSEIERLLGPAFGNDRWTSQVRAVAYKMRMS